VAVEASVEEKRRKIYEAPPCGGHYPFLSRFATHSRMDKSRILTTVISAISTLASSHPVLPRWIQDVYGNDAMAAAAVPLLAHDTAATAAPRARASSQEVAIQVHTEPRTYVAPAHASSNLRR
jgi:hypothetical protein